MRDLVCIMLTALEIKLQCGGVPAENTFEQTALDGEDLEWSWASVKLICGLGCLAVF